MSQSGFQLTYSYNSGLLLNSSLREPVEMMLHPSPTLMLFLTKNNVKNMMRINEVIKEVDGQKINQDSLNVNRHIQKFSGLRKAIGFLKCRFFFVESFM